jgi:hypothetical protein
MMTIVDFHCHHIPAGFPLTTIENSPPSQRARWLATNKLMSDEAFLLKDIESGDIDARVINAPSVQMADASGVLPHDTIMRVNDGPIRARLDTALAAAGLSREEQQRIAAGNTARLLGLDV